MEYIIGIDFDNTLVNYDRLIHSIALERGLIPADTAKNKKTIRDAIRRFPAGEIEWQRLQAVLYGPGMKEARLARGVKPFFELAGRCGARVYIISHKTEFAWIHSAMQIGRPHFTGNTILEFTECWRTR